MIRKLGEQKHLTIARIAAGYTRQSALADDLNAMLPDGEKITSNTLSKLENGWLESVSRRLADALMARLGISETNLTKGGIHVREKE